MVNTNRHSNSVNKDISPRSRNLIILALVAGFVIIVNLLVSFSNIRLDLTEEKRYTLTPATVKMLKNLKDNIYVEVLLDGNLPAGFKRLQESTQSTLDQFRNQTSYIQYRFLDPLDTKSTQDKNERIKDLADQGIKPTNLRVMENNEATEKLIYPVAVVKYGSQVIPVNLLENSIAGFSDEEVLNQSINLLEYKLADAINKILRKSKPTIAFTKGHGESKPIESRDLLTTLAPFYNLEWINLDSIYKVPDNIKLIIVSNPSSPFSEKEKFVLDQYIMRGGNCMFLINRLKIDMDSLRNPKSEYVPIENELNLEDMFFKYGFRIEPNLVLDLECSKIPLVVGKLGTGVQTELFPWYYAPILAGTGTHPIIKNIDRVNAYWTSTIDTVKTKTHIVKTNLLASSKHSRLQYAPVRINFEILRYEPDPSKFDKPYQPVAWLLEGKFPSLYENRVSPEMMNGLAQLKMKYLAEGTPAKIMVMSYGKLINNVYNPQNNEYLPLGYNTFDKHLYGNKDFVINSIEYMFDETGILTARAKEVKLRLLDDVKIKEEKTYWQILNVLVPILILGLGTLIFNFIRKKRFATHA
ncbi:MAG: gliding motility-associated ABC transporter substrate-binding protein GldG [Saprospiraceae bacterium]|nr:gliding motility-associated ABC transporter substrate-binding protein GldG [Saprospiraceae bacterium]